MTRERLLSAADWYYRQLPETPARNRAWVMALIDDLVSRALDLPPDDRLN